MGFQGKKLGEGNSGAKWGQWDRNLGGKVGGPRDGVWGVSTVLGTGIWDVRGGSQSRDFRRTLEPGFGCHVGLGGMRIWGLNRSGCFWGQDLGGK